MDCKYTWHGLHDRPSLHTAMDVVGLALYFDRYHVNIAWVGEAMNTISVTYSRNGQIKTIVNVIV